MAWGLLDYTKGRESMNFIKEVSDALVTKVGEYEGKDKLRIDFFGGSVEVLCQAGYIAEGTHDALRLIARMWSPGRVSISVEIN